MITVVLGGTRSGKSALAERIATELGSTAALTVTYIATARLNPADDDHRRRIAVHRARRPEEWATVECRQPSDLIGALAAVDGVALVDSLGSWVSGHPSLDPDIDALVAALENRSAPTVIVSEEVGLAVHPLSEVGRRYVDVLGSVNQAVAAVAARVTLVVAGRTVDLAPVNLASFSSNNVDGLGGEGPGRHQSVGRSDSPC